MATNVKWWVSNKEEAAKQGKRGRYVETTLTDILLNWNNEKGKTQDVKFIKVSSGRSNCIEFLLYNSDTYTTNLNKMYQNLPIIHGKLQAVVERIMLKRKITPNDRYQKDKWTPLVSAIEKLESLSLEERSKPHRNRWLSLDDINELLLDVEELMQNLDVYEVMETMIS